MQKSDIRRRYLEKLLRAFLGVSIVPLVLSIAAIIGSTYLYTLDQYSRQIENVLSFSNEKLERLMDEHIMLADSLATSISTYSQGSDMAFSEGSTEMNIISAMMAGRKNKMNIHILGSDGLAYHTGPTYNLYDLKTYSQWGLLYQLRHSDGATCVFSANFGQGQEAVAFSVGKLVRTKYDSGEIYIIIDITKQAIYDLLLSGQEPLTDFFLVDAQGTVIVDTRNILKPGYYLDFHPYSKKLQGNNHIISRDGEEYFTEFLQNPTSGYTIFAFLPMGEVRKNMKNLITIALPILLLTLCLCFIIAERTTRSMYRPIDSMVDLISAVSEGNLSVRMSTGSGDDEINLVATGFNNMLDKINELLEKGIEQSERQKEAEFKALQAQINPHFLYNMLNEIKALAKLNRTREVAEFVVCLGKLLRSTITEAGQFVTVSEDIDFVKAYLNLQQIRFENSFQCSVEIEEEILQCKILKLILQPIVENSILHGLENNMSGGMLRITGARQGDKVCFEIYDSGCGVNQGYMSYINDVAKGASMYGSHGLENVQKRLLLVYGAEYGVRIESQMDSYTMVSVYIPYEPVGEEGTV